MKKLLLIAAATAVLSNYAHAEAGVAVGINLGTQGIGIESRVSIMESLYGRLGVNYTSFTKGVNNGGGLNYKVKRKFLTVPLILDYHPVVDSGFRLSAGVAYNNHQFTGCVSPVNNVTLSGHTYTPSEIGSVKTKLTLGNKIAPILSIGYDSSLVNDSNWSFNAELGAMYYGKAKLKISASGLSGQDGQLIDDLNRDANKRFDKIKKYLKWYPILSIGMKYKF